MSPARRVLVTGGGGYLGSQVVAALAGRGTEAVVSLDVREAPPERRRPGVVHAAAGDVERVVAAVVDGFLAHGRLLMLMA